MARGAVGVHSVGGVSVGQAEDSAGRTGVTVLRFAQATPTVVDVRGGASATYDTASLALEATFGRRWAVFLTGGSLYGLDAARGVRTRLLETGAGHSAFGHPVRVAPVSGAALFDLPSDPSEIPEYLALGYEATRRAANSPLPGGRFGAGAGATVGKYRGRSRAMRGGVGSAAARWGPGRVGVVVAVNAVGAILDPSSGAWVAGARSPGGGVTPPDPRRPIRPAATGTTLAAVVTDLGIERTALQRIAAIVHAGLGRVIVPYQTSVDGDVVFVSSTGVAGRAPAEPWPGAVTDRVGATAAELAIEAVLAAVRAGNRPD